MMKKTFSVCLAAALTMTTLTPTILQAPTTAQAATTVEDGKYEVQTIGYYEGKPSDYAQSNIDATATVTVKDGKQTIALSLKNASNYKDIQDANGKDIQIVRGANDSATVTFEGTNLLENGVTAILHIVVEGINYDHHYEMQYKFDLNTLVSKEAPQTTRTLTATAKNNVSKKDTVTVKGIQKGDTVRLYNGKETFTKTATSSTVTFTVSQLGKKAGTAYMTVQAAGERESAKVAVTYKAEPDSATVNKKKVVVHNNKGKTNDKVVVKGLKKGDVLRFYDTLGNGLGRVTATSATATFKTKSLKAKGGKIYISRTQTGKVTSKKVAISYTAEK